MPADRLPVKAMASRQWASLDSEPTGRLKAVGASRRSGRFAPLLTDGGFKMARSCYCAVAFRFSDSPAVCWLARTRCGFRFSLSSDDRALFASAADAGAVGAKVFQDLVSSGVLSGRWVVVRIQ